MHRPLDGLLLRSARDRLAVAALVVLVLWGTVLWAILAVIPQKAPSDQPAAPAEQVLRPVVVSGQAAPSGGTFDRFDVMSQPVVAPVNAKGHVAFYAGLTRTRQREGIFLSTGTRMMRLAAVGDAVAGAGTLSEFAKHPTPSLSDADKVAFGAAVAGARASEGIFLAGDGGIKVIALSGDDAPGIPTGTFVEFDAPALNNRDEIVFVATVRRGRETEQVLYLYGAGKLRKLVAEGEPLPASPSNPMRRGTFDRFGVPAINNKGVVVFPAVIERGPVLGGLFVAGTRDLRLLVGAGETAPNGAMMVRFSERVAIDDDDEIAFATHLSGAAAANSEGVFMSTSAGLVPIAAIGDSAPGGGRYAAFATWPTLGPGGMVAFVGALDDGPGPVGVFAWRGGDTRRLALPGDRLADGTQLAAFALNPVATAGPNGGVTFATVAAPEAGQTGIYYVGPVPSPE